MTPDTIHTIIAVAIIFGIFGLVFSILIWALCKCSAQADEDGNKIIQDILEKKQNEETSD